MRGPEREDKEEQEEKLGGIKKSELEKIKKDGDGWRLEAVEELRQVKGLGRVETKIDEELKQAKNLRSGRLGRTKNLDKRRSSDR